ncbi:hypothetical protein Mapa_016547 [Marchantia paleacea]|nr:hypothetical protein Mapa_016547 [Marchantia paleacea]
MIMKFRSGQGDSLPMGPLGGEALSLLILVRTWSGDRDGDGELEALLLRAGRVLSTKRSRFDVSRLRELACRVTTSGSESGTSWSPAVVTANPTPCRPGGAKAKKTPTMSATRMGAVLMTVPGRSG